MPLKKITDYTAGPGSIHFTVPRNISTILESYEFFASVSAATNQLKNNSITIDFRNTAFFDSNVCSIMGGIIHKLILDNNMVFLANIEPEVDDIFQQNCFYSVFTNQVQSSAPSFNTVIPCNKFSAHESELYLQYIEDELFSRSGLLQMSDLLKNKINLSLLEIFNNAHEHGCCGELYVSGHHFPKKKIICLTICDMGVTIRTNVNSFFSKQFKGPEAIKWAVQYGHTTRRGNIPGGLGFSIIRDFLRVNEGKLQIISSNGMWEESKGIIFDSKLSNKFQGTIVNLEFNIDKKYYILTEEVDLKNIF